MSGSAHYSISLVREGWHACVQDIAYSPDLNICDTGYQNRIRLSVTQYWFDSYHLAVDCRTWTRLANPPYRSPTKIMGLSSITDATDAKNIEKLLILDDANKMFLFCIEIFILCQQERIQCTMENGLTSMFWIHILIQQLMANSFTFTVDFCAFGTPYKKPTKFISVFDLVAVADDSLTRRCKCKPRAKFGGKKHAMQLKGQMKVKRNGKTTWLARSKCAQVYPQSFCDVWALATTALYWSKHGR